VVVAVFNLLITLTLISVLRISVGMESIQIVKGGLLLPGAVDMDNLYKPDGNILGFYDDPIVINGDGGAVDLLVSPGAAGGSREDPDSQRVSLAHDSVTVQGVRRAGVSLPAAQAFFNTAYPNFGLPAGVRSLRVRNTRTSRVVSPVHRSLKLTSTTQTQLRGSEGTHIDGKELVLSADQELYLKSVNGSVVLLGKQGVRLDVRGIPWAQGRRTSDDARAEYRLCACMPEGRLFRIPVLLESIDRLPTERVTCSNAALYGDNNPCA